MKFETGSFTGEIETLLAAADVRMQTISPLVSSDRNIYIYGAGNFGKAVYRLLTEAGIRPQGFVDRQGSDESCNAFPPVYSPACFKELAVDRTADLVVISYLCSNESFQAAKSVLVAEGFSNVIYFLDIYALHATGSLVSTSPLSEAASGPSVSTKIVTTASLLLDRESQDVFRSFLTAVLSGNADLFSPMTTEPQYLASIPLNKGYARVIDCGAFDGDTALAIAANRPELKSVVCFEPDQQNFVRLCDNLSSATSGFEKILFPCGVWNRTETMRFKAGTDTTSGISDSGESFIQCVSIDEAIPDFNPTFLKMDVEGAEPEAISGARNTIRNSVPDLAISVYHNIEHMWEIPLFIKELVPEYSFYLRSHGDMGLETVLYASASNPYTD